MSEAPVVNASPLIYLAHSGLIPLLEVAGSPVRVPGGVAAEIRRRGPEDPTARTLREVPWQGVFPWQGSLYPGRGLSC